MMQLYEATLANGTMIITFLKINQAEELLIILKRRKTQENRQNNKQHLLPVG
jgi:hypothetical protein